MIVSAFMTPRDKVVTCVATDNISMVLNKILEMHVGSVVVMGDTDNAVGLVTKTDLLKAYQESLPIDTKVDSIMSKQLKTVSDRASRDIAAGMFEKNMIHHVVVVKDDGKFAGIISALDIAKELSLDSKAWPWNRSVSTSGRALPAQQ